ncbi:polysaccharide biosynthesis C-terminal domain-containing protein [Myxococcota bacterium]|nr:polysaccharide biosynthesis C-terminal domain-containing protein [Myxococcota bacterium]MBU1431849.1 polysaccharide biosynthesis C-terminal domain-containing protein [Myxococcota bacterium]MBU1896676.1 polysaccharide biosynthesis C-terminal domain-containing protein [Myxococcota bacterium]
MNFSRNALSQLITALINLGFQFLAGVILARLLSVPDRGQYALVLGFVALSMVFTELGWSSASIYRVRRLGRPPAEVLASGLAGMLISAALAAALVLSLRGWIQLKLFDGGAPSLIYLALALIPIALLTRLFNAMARATDRFRLQNQIRAVEIIALPLALLGGLWLSDGDLWIALWTTAAIRLASMLTIGVAITRRVGLGRPRLSEMRAALGFGVQSAALIFAHQVHAQVDLFMLAALREDGRAEVAVYGVAVGLAQLPKLFTEALAVALLPKLAGLPPAEAAAFTARLLRQLLPLMGIIALTALLGGAVALPLVYGDAYAASIPPFIALAPAVLFFALSHLLSRYFIALARQRTPLLIQLGCVALNLTLNALWIPAHGPLGAALASLISYASAAILLTVAFKRHSGVSLSEILILKARDWAELKARGAALLKKLGLIRAGGAGGEQA